LLPFGHLFTNKIKCFQDSVNLICRRHDLSTASILLLKLSNLGLVHSTVVFLRLRTSPAAMCRCGWQYLQMLSASRCWEGEEIKLCWVWNFVGARDFSNKPALVVRFTLSAAVGRSLVRFSHWAVQHAKMMRWTLVDPMDIIVGRYLYLLCRNFSQNGM
jgi:hypothetical protein